MNPQVRVGLLHYGPLIKGHVLVSRQASDRRILVLRFLLVLVVGVWGLSCEEASRELSGILVRLKIAL